jgi:hypothetical protein
VAPATAVDAATTVIPTTAEMPTTAIKIYSKNRNTIISRNASKKGSQQQKENYQKQGRKQQQDSRGANSSKSLATTGPTAVTKTIRRLATPRHLNESQHFPAQFLKSLRSDSAFSGLQFTVVDARTRYIRGSRFQWLVKRYVRQGL